MHVYGKYPSITQLQRYGHDDVTLVISRKKKKTIDRSLWNWVKQLLEIYFQHYGT